ncbi:hypothetical protein CROQUDRAFT_90067 [Cronartium quercuum f. sp. fusiforme G11]|uniref:Uncharacterized protein n=1 Tax=Cronartium quercuum f. sp. fusiforme G11 TaxID=708437 RepID=A0A9P6TDP4_9BASI|nr:hypothetical protein CROQUDRAFT_90067 [Cronartium quercuum f. sp. fusiforme G11]
MCGQRWGRPWLMLLYSPDQEFMGAAGEGPTAPLRTDFMSFAVIKAARTPK